MLVKFFSYLKGFHNGFLKFIILLSVILRISAAVYMGDKVEELPGTFDQISYHNLALRVLAGHGFSFDQEWWPITKAGAPTAHWSFLYTFFLVGVYALFGPHPIAARIIQAVIVGILHPWVAFLLGKSIFGEAEGLVAAAITAVYAYFFYYAGTLMTEPFYITAILGGIFLVIATTEKKPKSGIVRGLVIGIVLGLTVLLRQLYLLLIPFILAWFAWVVYRRNNRIPFVEIGAILLTIAGLILPFSIYNQSRFNRFVLLNTNSGYAFFWGNHPIYGTKFVPILTPEMGTYQDLIPQEVRELDEAALDQELLKRGIQFIKDDPGRYVLLTFSRIPAYFMFWPSKDSGLISNISRVGSFGLFLPFMIIGILVSIWNNFKVKHLNFIQFLTGPEGLLWIFGLIYTAIHLLTWALIRYRLPVDAILVLYASVAFVYLARMVSRQINTKQNGIVIYP